MDGYEMKSFDVLVASLPLQEKINFLAACRLIYDNVARVLRGLCRREYSGDAKLPLPTENLVKDKVEVDLENVEFSALVDHLLYRKRTGGGSFFKKVSCKFIIFDKADGTKRLELVPVNNSSVTLKAGGQVQIPSGSLKDRISLEKIEGSRYCIPYRKSIKDGASVDVYLPTDTWYCVNELRNMRNSIAHSCAANLTNDRLKGMFKRVREIYEKIMVHDADKTYKELQEIETSCKDWSEEGVRIALMKYKKKVEEYWQELAALNERVGITESRYDVMEDEVDAFKTKVDASETITQGRLDALETTSRDTQETVKKTFTAGKDYVDSRVNDLQSQTDDIEERVGHLEKSARGSGPTVNIFSGHGYTVNQNVVVFPQSTGAGYTSPPQPGAAYQTYNCLQRPQLPRPSSQFAPGAPTQDEITHLSTKIINCPLYSLGRVNFTKLAKALGMEECVTSIQRDSPQPYAQVSTLLTQWVEQNPDNNSRDRLYKLLCDVSLSSPAYSVFNSQ